MAGPTLMQFAKGTSYVDLNSRVYRLVSWSPSIPQRTRAVIGVDGPYAEVEEAFEIMIVGATESEALSAFHALVLMLDEAQAFYDGVQATPVTWRIKTADGANILADMILGYGSDAPVQPSATWSEKLRAYILPNIVVSFRRRGRLVREVEETSTTSAAAAIGTLHSVTFSTNADVASPLRIQFGGAGSFISGTPSSVTNGMLLVGRSSSSFSIIEAESMSFALGYSSVADGLACSGGAVLRYTPGGTTRAQTAWVSATVPKRCAIILETRNNTAGKNYTIDLEVRADASTSIRSGVEIIDAATTLPRFITLPPLSLPKAGTQISLGIQADSAGGTLDIDRVILLDLTDPYAAAVVHGAANLISNLTPVGTDAFLVADHQYLTALDPAVSFRRSVGVAQALCSTVESNPALNSIGTTCAAMLLELDGSGTWAPASGGSRLNVQLTATRLLASLTPR